PSPSPALLPYPPLFRSAQSRSIIRPAPCIPRKDSRGRGYNTVNGTGLTDLASPAALRRFQKFGSASAFQSDELEQLDGLPINTGDRKSTRLNSSHVKIS